MALNANARAAIEEAGNNVFVSAASVWEIAIKRRLGQLIFAGSASAAIDANGFHALPISPLDAERTGDLPRTHGDPFDRLLVAQSTRLGLILVTADRTIRSFIDTVQLWAG